MQWPSVFLVVFIISSNSFTFGMNNKFLRRNYVSPNKTAQCSGTGFPCLILQEYASQPDAYFINNTIVYYEPGSHQLNSSLKLTNVHNFTVQGLPGDVDANVLLGSLVSITWKNCSNIEIFSLTFSLLKSFAFSIVFEHTQLVQLSNISVFGYGNEHVGCSSIMSRHSTLCIRDSSFAGIQGSIGAALLVLQSCVIFYGNNTFLDNSASLGGSLYILESVVTLSGTNTFMRNNSSKEVSDCIYTPVNEDIIDYDWMRGSGGAIFCNSSMLIINSEYSVFYP